MAFRREITVLVSYNGCGGLGPDKFCRAVNISYLCETILQLWPEKNPIFQSLFPCITDPMRYGSCSKVWSGRHVRISNCCLSRTGTRRCDEVAGEYSDRLTIRYFYKENSGRSLTRNYGMERAEGRLFGFFRLRLYYSPLLISRRCAVVSKRPMSTVTAVPMQLIVLFPGCKRPSIML